MKSNVAIDGKDFLMFEHCQTCGAKRMMGPQPEYFCGAKQRIEDGKVTWIAECPRNRPRAPA